MIAEKEELFDNKDHGVLAYQRAKGPKNLVTVPKITHYGIYYEAWDQAHKLALEWFDKYMKGKVGQADSLSRPTGPRLACGATV